ncbi:MAG: hypothetical protein M4579_002075 [Chaenotheca gracillima]|nr:MAG: hypothetical protein M4579_002075 [Chaenotheca gracillima]
MSANDNSSTLKSYVDSASGAAQSALGSLTGSNADKAQGENKRDQGAAEKDLSHATAKAGPFNMSSSGAVTKDDPNRTEGSWNQTVGSGKEMLGNAIGAQGLKQEGIQQNREGKGQEAQGQLSDLGSGIGDRFKGTVGSAASGLTGNREEQARFQDQHDRGKTTQRGAEADIQKQADA